MIRKMLLVFELKKELAHISQGSLDIASYFNKIKQLQDAIDALSISRVRSCSNCGFKSNYQNDDDVQKVYQFLTGVNDAYVHIRSNIFMIKPFPSVSTVYNILLLNERQRQFFTSPKFFSSFASLIPMCPNKSFLPKLILMFINPLHANTV